jgi:hypothetical protein
MQSIETETSFLRFTADSFDRKSLRPHAARTIGASPANFQALNVAVEGARTLGIIG